MKDTLEKESRKFSIKKYTDMKMIYRAREENRAKEKTRIFGKDFVDRNKKICRIIYKNKKYKLTEFIEDIDNNYLGKTEIHLKLLTLSKIINLSYIFLVVVNCLKYQ